MHPADEHVAALIRFLKQRGRGYNQSRRVRAARRPMRRMADTLGVTGALTADSHTGVDPDHASTVGAILGAGMGGDPHTFVRARRDFGAA